MPQPNNQPKKHRTRANAAMKTRTLFCVTLFIVGAFGLLIYQLYALQLRDAELYRTEAVTQQLKDTTLPRAARLDLQRQRQAACQEQHGMEYRCRPFLYRQERRVGEPAAHGGGKHCRTAGRGHHCGYRL